jgi:hypothetical protein
MAPVNRVALAGRQAVLAQEEQVERRAPLEAPALAGSGAPQV